MRSALILLILTLSGMSSAWSANYPPAVFAKGQQFYSVKISPTGEYIALGVTSDNERKIAVIDAKTFKTIGISQFPYPRQVGPFYWVNDERLVIKVLQARAWESEPLYYGELFAVDYDGGRGELIYGYSAGESTLGSRMVKKKATRGWAEIENFLEEDDKHILISSESMSESRNRGVSLMKLNVYTGKMKKIDYSPLPYSDFIFDRNNTARFVHGLDEDGSDLFYKFVAEKDEWQPLEDIKLGEGFWPLGFDEDNKKLFFLNNVDKDKTGLYTYYPDSGKVKHVYTDEKADITDINFTSDKSTAYAIRVDAGYPEYLIFDKKDEEAKVFRTLLDTFAGNIVEITSTTSDNQKWVIFVSSDTDRGAYYLFDREAGKLSLLFQVQKSLKEKDMAVTTPYTVKAQDDVEIPVYLTLPENGKGPVPLVTLVHGGPIGVRDYWGFDPEVQMLADQGYAVLRVNYRGSGGYGYEFRHAGYRKWGSLIQQDIIDATNWARELPEINADKVCIMGASFGGYSALQSSILAGDVFDCAVANAGVYDLEDMYEDGDIPELFFGKASLEAILGADKEELRKFSPTKNVSKLNTPVLIAHGKKDRRAPFSQAEELKEALDEAGKSYEWFVRSSETHGFHDEENRAAYFEKVAAFLEQHLK